MEHEAPTHEHHEHEASPEQHHGVSRRTLLLTLGWGSVLVSIAVTALGAVRGLIPNVLYEPPKKFKADTPADYPEGIVKLIAEESVFIDRDARGIFAVSAVCTHLGCRVDWVEEQNGYLCPCHGARFHRDGHNYGGPAPAPLPHWHVSVAQDGRLLVDKGNSVDQDYRLKV